jgi:hypothetical protein
LLFRLHGRDVLRAANWYYGHLDGAIPVIVLSAQLAPPPSAQKPQKAVQRQGGAASGVGDSEDAELDALLAGLLEEDRDDAIGNAGGGPHPGEHVVEEEVCDTEGLVSLCLSPLFVPL